ncbi:DinB family protein [Blastococcus sp. KM273128]|nr:DinB family protein [Blastococcus sp. KM273128]
MAPVDAKTALRRDLQAGRDAVLWKLEGLPEYDVRRPMTPTGTNLLGLVKHLAFVEQGYLGAVFGRPVPEAQAWIEDDGSEPNWDLWATADETREQVVDGYRRAWAHADATIGALPLDAPGHVPWWGPGRRDVTLHQVLVHVVAETHRHAGHADIVRELIDGAAGLRAGGSNLPEVDRAWWSAHRELIEQVARDAAAR